MTTTARTAALLLCLLAVGACRTAPSTPGTIAPPVATGQPAVAHAAGVAAANPYAVEAGLAILRAGGSAVDAAVAVQAVLGLVEPQSSGIGGGAFLLHYDAESSRVTAYDGRETAPAGATPDMFLDAAGQPLPYADAVTSGRATGVPGAMAMLGLAHERHGKLPWSVLFEGVAKSAEDGFVVPKRLARFANSQFKQATLPDARALFGLPDGGTVQAGDTLRNPAYAASLRTLAAGGPRALLEPPVADAIIARTHAEPLPGTLVAADFAAYRPREGTPLCRPYRDLRGVRAAAAVERRVAAADARDPRAHRHRHARPGRSAGVVPVRRGEPTDVRRPRPLRGRPGLRAGAGERDARPHLRGGTRAAHRRARRPAARRGRSTGPDRGAIRQGRDRRGRGHQPLRGRGFAWRRGVHDDVGRVAVRFGPRGRRVLPQQPAHRLLVPCASTTVCRSRTRWRRASDRARRCRR